MKKGAVYPQPPMTQTTAGGKIFLVGYRACGKSSVGRLLALRLNWDFLDMDQEICRREGCTIRELVAEHGWEHFRAKERALLEELNRRGEGGAEISGAPVARESAGVIVATGGGAVLHRDLWEEIKRKSLVVWLTADPEIIAQRLGEDAATPQQRPALTDLGSLSEEIKEVLAQRRELYQEASHLKIDTTSLTPEEITERIISDHM